MHEGAQNTRGNSMRETSGGKGRAGTGVRATARSLCSGFTHARRYAEHAREQHAHWRAGSGI
eukprot:362402-Chlamydomonas_euryale.AAC.1